MEMIHMDAEVVYDNPRTRQREWYKNGKVVASISEELLEINVHMRTFTPNKVQAGDKTKLPQVIQIELKAGTE